MIITCSKLITSDNESETSDDSAVVISRGVIKTVGPSKKISQRFRGHRVLRLNDAVLMPGLINTHTHLELPPLLSQIKSRTFSGWILGLIRAKKLLDDKDYSSSARENIKSLIRNGTTTAGEICSHDISPALLKASGLRAVVFREIINMGPDGNGRKSTTFKFPTPYERHSGLLTKGLSPHSPYTVSEAVLRSIKRVSLERNIRLAMHIAESKDEIKLMQRNQSGLEKLYEFAGWDLDWAPRGATAFEYLRRIGFLPSGLLAVHAVQVTDEDIALIKKSKISVAHCPRSNEKIRVGTMPLKKFLDAGIHVGLGTDSLASVPNLNMWDEMRYAHKIHKKDGVTAEDIFKLATIGGAKALGLDKEIGTLEPGKKADLIAVPLPKKDTGDLYSDLLRETKSCIMTMVNGKILYREGQGSEGRGPV
jgi:cytosine/adenosine deaminase-related metal-dependent hydrolase